MKNRNTLIIAVIALAVAGTTGAVVAARGLSGCSPPRDHAEIIELFKADALVTAVPYDGQLISERTSPGGCIETRDGIGASNIQLIRQYSVPAPYSLDQLHERFDRPATAAGWRIEQAERPWAGFAKITYCKPIGGRASHAGVESTASEGVLVNVYAADYDSKCDWMWRTPKRQR